MKKLFPLAFFLAVVLPQVHAEEIDITDRSATDPLLKISTLSTFITDDNNPTWQARRDEDSNPPKYSRIWGRSDVFVLEPLNQNKPATADFSAITTNHKGELKLDIRNHPRGDFVLEIYKNDKLDTKETIRRNSWQKFTVPFDHEPVVVKAVANNWYCEFCFLTYKIQKKD